MSVTLHRCRFEWLRSGPCWRVEKALQDMGIDYRVAPGPSRPSKRARIIEHTGQRLYPAIEFEDGTWYREESKDMEEMIRAGKLTERPPASSSTGEASIRDERPRQVGVDRSPG
jgi:hypothetical protein